LIAALFVLGGGLGRDGYELARVVTWGLPDALLVVAAFVGGAVATPLLLPYLPGRAFALKGMWVGVFGTGGLWYALFGLPGRPGPAALAAWLLIGGALASFVAMNFTGASTYTSLSGVRKEMRHAVPCQLMALVVGLGLWAVARFG
jgi:acetyl-CoA decarbonylase/synthase complex subunit gamma